MSKQLSAWERIDGFCNSLNARGIKGIIEYFQDDRSSDHPSLWDDRETSTLYGTVTRVENLEDGNYLIVRALKDDSTYGLPSIFYFRGELEKNLTGKHIRANIQERIGVGINGKPYRVPVLKNFEMC